MAKPLKLTQNKIRTIRELFQEGYAQQYLARKFHVQNWTINHHIFDLIPANSTSPRVARKSLTEEQVLKLRILAVTENIPSNSLGEMFRVSPSTALSCLKGKTYRWVGGPTKPHRSSPIVTLKPVALGYIKPRSDRKPGPNSKTTRQIKWGGLLKLSKKYRMKPSTLCKHLKSGKKILTASEKIKYLV